MKPDNQNQPSGAIPFSAFSDTPPSGDSDALSQNPATPANQKIPFSALSATPPAPAPTVTPAQPKTVDMGDVLGVGIPGLNNPIADPGVQASLEQAGENIKQSVMQPSTDETPSGIPSAISRPIDLLERAVSTGGAIVGGVFNVGTKVAESMIPQPIKEALSKDISAAGQKSGVAPLIDKINQGLQASFANDPDGLRTAMNLLNVGMLGLGSPEVAQQAKGGVADLSGMLTAPSDLAKEYAAQGEARAAASAAANQEAAATVAQKEWEDEAANQGGKAATIFSKAESRNIDIPKMLTDRGITSYSLMGDDGKFATGNAVNGLKNEADNLYKSSLGTLIKSSDAEGATIDLKAIEEKAVQYAKTFNASKGDIASAISRIRAQFALPAKGETAMEGGLADEYGNEGIPVGDAESEKGAHWNEINWTKISPKTTADNVFNDAMGHGYQGAIEDELEGQTGLPKGTIKSMNGEIGKIRQVTKFLEEIDGDKPVTQPSKTVLGKMVKAGVRIGVGGAAEAMTGGLSGGVLGYIASGPLVDKIGDFIMNLPQALRAKTLSAMESEEPAVYKQIFQYVMDRENPKEPLNLSGAGSDLIRKSPKGDGGTSVQPPKTPSGGGFGIPKDADASEASGQPTKSPQGEGKQSLPSTIADDEPNVKPSIVRNKIRAKGGK